MKSETHESCELVGGGRTNPGRAAHLRPPEISRFNSSGRVRSILRWSRKDLVSQRFRLMLYRFLTDNIPIINACVWTWARLASSTGAFKIEDGVADSDGQKAQGRLSDLTNRLYVNALGNRVGLATLLPDLFTGLFRDGLWAGFLSLTADSSGVDSFLPVDPINISRRDSDTGEKMFLELDNLEVDLDRPDFYCLSLNNGNGEPFGGSILRSVPFVSYIEQQLVEDMRRASHNAGFHRLHVKLTPPEPMAGESDSAYADRINGYFDDTVNMIRSCEVDDNPVTWDNVAIEYIGPSSSRDVSNSWFMNHRAMVEDICAGTNLAPYLLGYSYGATTTWSAFKFDIVMRQVRSVQAEAARFLEWIGNIELALSGSRAKCRFEFDNTFAYQAMEKTTILSSRVDNILKLFQAGLIDETMAREKARDLL